MRFTWWWNMGSNLKNDLCKKILSSGLVKPYDIVEHSYTDGGGRTIEKLIVSANGIFPTLTTRPDCLGVVVIDEEK